MSIARPPITPTHRTPAWISWSTRKPIGLPSSGTPSRCTRRVSKQTVSASSPRCARTSMTAGTPAGPLGEQQARGPRGGRAVVDPNLTDQTHAHIGSAKRTNLPPLPPHHQHLARDPSADPIRQATEHHARGIRAAPRVPIGPLPREVVGPAKASPVVIVIGLPTIEEHRLTIDPQRAPLDRPVGSHHPAQLGAGRHRDRAGPGRRGRRA